MRTSLVNHAAGVIHRAMQRSENATNVAFALDAAQMLQDPMTAKEHADLKARVAELEAQLSAGRCGTYAGYHRHLKKGEEPCEACREGRRARDREYHARNRKQINDRRRNGGAW